MSTQLALELRGLQYLAEQAFGLALRPGAIPVLTAPTGLRVNAGVDDDAPAIALLADVAFHVLRKEWLELRDDFVTDVIV